MPNDTYNANSSMTFDPKTRQWVKKVTETADPNTIVSETKKAASEAPTTGSNTQVNSKGKAESDFAKNNENTLTGDLEVIPSNKTIRVTVGDTITISGVGKYLSGQYYVTKISRQVTNSDGYSNSFSVSKNGFADNLKGGMTAEGVRSEVVK